MNAIAKVMEERRKREMRVQQRAGGSEERRRWKKGKGEGGMGGYRLLPWQQVNQADILHLNSNLDVKRKEGLVSGENNLRMSTVCDIQGPIIQLNSIMLTLCLATSSQSCG